MKGIHIYTHLMLKVLIQNPRKWLQLAALADADGADGRGRLEETDHFCILTNGTIIAEI